MKAKKNKIQTSRVNTDKDNGIKRIIDMITSKFIDACDMNYNNKKKSINDQSNANHPCGFS